jgi:hypothetical protein
MKKIRFITALVLALVLTGSLAVMALPNKFTVEVPYGEPATSAIGADWGTPNKASGDMLGWGGALDDGVPFDYYFMWSEKGLFVATDITMPNPIARNDGSDLDASHAGNCDRFQIAFNPGNGRDVEAGSLWFTYSVLEDGKFHIVREDAENGGSESVAAQCPGTAIVNGGKFQAAFMIPWDVINVDAGKFTAQAGLKMDIHLGICFAGDNAAEVTGGAEKIEAANVSEDLPHTWVVGAMPVTLSLAAKVEAVPETQPEPVPVPEEPAPAPAEPAPAPAPAPVAPATGDPLTITLALLAISGSAALLGKKKK